MAASNGTHPVLWCDERRKIEERKWAHENSVLAKLSNDKRYEEKVRDRQEFKRMIETYNPWGKKGGGAPNTDIRMKNLYSEGLYPEPKTNPRTPISPPARLKYRGTETGGGGAPIRDSSSKIITHFKDDPLLSFNDPNKGHVDLALRYKTNPLEQTQYRQELDRLTAEQLARRLEEKRGLKEFLPNKPMMSEYTDMNKQPWGKPCPGGVPWRDPKNLGHNFLKSLGFTNKEILKQLDKSHSSPAEKIKPLNLDTSRGNKINFKENVELTACCSLCICECPTRYGKSKTDDMVRARTPYPKPIQTAIPKSVQRKSPLYHPKKKFKNGDSETYMMTGGVELVPLLAKRRASPRPISLSSTDVTKLRNIQTSCKEQGPTYLNDLNSQIYERYREIEAYRQRDAEISRQHYETWQTFWGRPGHGAPKEIKTKLNLNALLYKDPYRHCKYSKA